MSRIIISFTKHLRRSLFLWGCHTSQNTSEPRARGNAFQFWERILSVKILVIPYLSFVNFCTSPAYWRTHVISHTGPHLHTHTILPMTPSLTQSSLPTLREAFPLVSSPTIKQRLRDQWKRNLSYRHRFIGEFFMHSAMQQWTDSRD